MTFNTKRAIICAYPLCLLFTTLPLVSVGKIHIGLSFSIFIVIIIVSLYKSYRYINKNPLLTPIKLIVCGYLLSWLFGAERSSIYPLTSAIVTTIIPLFIFPFIERKQDVYCFIKCMCLVLLASVLYALVEFSLGKNVWMYWLQSQTSATIFHDHIDNIRFGYGRCNSFFDFPIPFGDVCAIFFSFLLFYKYSYIELKINGRYIIILMGLMLVGLILSNSRAPVMAFFVGILHYPMFRNTKKFLFAVLFVITIIIIAHNSIFLIVDSLFGDNYADVSGSSSSMRINQFAICLDQFLKYPYFGGGLNRMEYLQGALKGEGLYGGESILFILMVNQGLVGIIPYFLAFFYMVKVFKKEQRRFPLFLSLAWLTASLASLTTGVTIAFPMVLLLVVYRSYRLGMIK